MNDWPTPSEARDIIKFINNSYNFLAFLKLIVKENDKLELTTKPNDLVYSRKMSCLIAAEGIFKFYDKNEIIYVKLLSEIISKLSPYPHLSDYIKELKKLQK